MRTTHRSLLLAASCALSCALAAHTLIACSDAAGPAMPAAGPNAVAIAVRSEPAGASVIVDGTPIGAAPQTVKLNPGPHRLRATMSGYYPTQDTHIQVGAGEPVEHVLTLVASH